MIWIGNRLIDDDIDIGVIKFRCGDLCVYYILSVANYAAFKLYSEDVIQIGRISIWKKNYVFSLHTVSA